MSETWHTLQTRVQQTVDDLVGSGRESGVQVAAYLHGRQIIDVHAGAADPGTGRPVTAHTPFFSYSTGKALTSTVVHVLAEQGRLDYDLRIADVWPEYARHGKDATTLRHALTHTAGVPTLPADITAEDFTDWDRMCAIIADSRPEWPPGTAMGYHAWTYGWLVGEVVRRVTGRAISDVLATEVAGPLGVPDELFLAVPEANLDGLAVLADRNWAASLAAMAEQIPSFDLVSPPGVRPGAGLGNRRDVLMANVPAGGTVSARAVARMYAALLGEVDGVRLISGRRLREVSSVAFSGVDWVFGQEAAFGLGYAVIGDMFGMSGSGGSLAYGFPQLGLTIAATKNLMGDGDGDPMEDLRAMIQDAVADSAQAAAAPGSP